MTKKVRATACELMRVLATALCAVSVAAADDPRPRDVWPDEEWQSATPAAVGLDEALLQRARDYALTGGGSGMITRHGQAVMIWGDPKQTYDLKSTSKSIGVTALGLAIKDGKIRLADRAIDHHPQFGTPPESNAATGWLKDITLRHLATQTAGFEKPGGHKPLLFQPGTKWHYSDGGPNWLAECVTLAYERDVEDLMFDRVLTPIGIERSDLRWRQNQYRPHHINGIPRREFGSGVHANVNAMARLGLLYLRRGRWKDTQILPESFVDLVRATDPAVVGLPEHETDHGNASDHYGLLWWNNADGTIAQVPRDAYWSWGLYDSLIVVIPSLDIVAARTGKSWKRKDGDAHYAVLSGFLEPIAAAAGFVDTGDAAVDGLDKQDSASFDPSGPYPPSPVIESITFAPLGDIRRMARGSDNWPLTWADDGHLYTAYGDGRGFSPFVEKKLSLGLARVEGGPHNFHGVNIRSNDAEATGDGKNGRKASGMLMVDGRLFLFVRNARNSHLGWSEDHAQSWTWADWKFESGFGCPTFLNFGRDYDGARDEFAYLYSMDSETAYDPSDRMVMARVHKDRLETRTAWQFFKGIDDLGQPIWTDRISERGAVFSHPDRCYRSGVTYNPGLNRYLWCQTLPASSDSRGPRFQGGFGIYDAPEPWGPWTTAFFASVWDTGPGETSSLPTKWMSDDGLSMSLVFSGDDHFSVRKATVTLRGDASTSKDKRPAGRGQR